MLGNGYFWQIILYYTHTHTVDDDDDADGDGEVVNLRNVYKYISVKEMT